MIPHVDPKIETKISSIVEKILSAKRHDQAIDTERWEKEIDHLVYEIYGLTNEEISIIEHALS